MKKALGWTILIVIAIIMFVAICFVAGSFSLAVIVSGGSIVVTLLIALAIKLIEAK